MKNIASRYLIVVITAWLIWVVCLFIYKRSTGELELSEEYHGIVFCNGRFELIGNQSIIHPYNSILLEYGFKIAETSTQETFGTKEVGTVFSKIDQLNSKTEMGFCKVDDNLGVFVKKVSTDQSGDLNNPMTLFEGVELNQTSFMPQLFSIDSQTLKIKPLTPLDGSKSRKGVVLNLEVFPVRLASNHYELQVTTSLRGDRKSKLDIEIDSKFWVFIDSGKKMQAKPCSGFLYGSKNHGVYNSQLSLTYEPQMTFDGKTCTLVIQSKGNLSEGGRAYNYLIKGVTVSFEMSGH